MTDLHELLASVQARVAEQIHHETAVLHALQTVMDWCMTEGQFAARSVSATTRPLPLQTQVDMVLNVLAHASRHLSNREIRHAVSERYCTGLTGKQISEVLKSKRVRDLVMKHGNRRSGFTYQMKPSGESNESVNSTTETEQSSHPEEQAA